MSNVKTPKYRFVDIIFTSSCTKNHLLDGFINKLLMSYPECILLFKVTNKNTRKRCEVCSKLTINTPKRPHDVVLVPLLLTLNIFLTFF